MSKALLNNRYRIIRALGTGGFGETFLAEDTHMPSRRLCVIKQLKPITQNLHAYQLVQERFGREAAILEQLGEGNEQIPCLYAYFSEGGQFYLVQEWVEGVTLNQKLQQNGLFTESAVKAILVSLLPVLDYIHNRGIIHRDIKPSNIILRQLDGKPVLIDFGIAKETMGIVVNAEGEIASSIVVGTQGYMPPEQAAGKPVYASDLYSLVLTLIYLLTGKQPQDLERNLQTGEIIWHKYAPNISLSCAALLDKAIRPHSNHRYSAAREMLRALEPDEQAIPQLLENIPTSPIFPTAQVETTQPPELEILPLPSLNAGESEAKIPYSRQGYRNRQILLNKVKNYWVKGVLETSLHGKALIELGLEKHLDAIERPWGIVWETPDQTRQILPPKTKVIELFNQMGEGRTLLILGEPGSGKTTTLLELTRDLIENAQQDTNQPIPVVFNLSAWTNEKQEIAEWVVQELNTKYQVSKEIGKAWIKNQQLLLLLDGLDEVSAERRENCVTAINHFLQEYGHTEIVVCSRIKDYEILSNRLQLQGAVFIQPLTIEQIHQYLKNAGLEFSAVSTALQADTTLQVLAKSPLMLSIMTLAYQGMSITDLPKLNLEERRQHLFNKYIERMFARRSINCQYSKEQSLHWLSWLAQRLSQQSQTVFLIERMQPSWFQTQLQKQIYILGLVLSFLFLGGIVGQWVLDTHRLSLALLSGGLIFWLIFGFERISPVENLKWSWINARKNLVFGLSLGSILGLIIKLIYEPIYHPLHWRIFAPPFTNLPLYSFTRGLVFGFSLGLIFGLIRGLTSPSIQTRTVPNQGIWQSAKNAFVFGLIAFLVLGLTARTLHFLVLGLTARTLHWYFLFWGLFGLSFGAAVGGGEACIKHLILRLVLYYSGAIPWNYARFLDYATERIFLQKVGGGYIFVHRLLLEHFTQL